MARDTGRFEMKAIGQTPDLGGAAAFAGAAMTIRQYVAVAMCVSLNAVDGLDVLSISFAAPGISQEWGTDRAALGIVLSMELIGMAFGSLLFGQLADRAGRKNTVLMCIGIMGAGMFATTQANSIAMLLITRLVTGLGIGGMLATINAMVAEYASEKWRTTAVAFMVGGYPLGAIVGGSVAALLLKNGGWRDIFYFGASLTVVVFPLALWLMPEPVSALLNRRRPGTLARVNRSLLALGHLAWDSLPPEEPVASRQPVTALFARGLAPVTLLLTVAYFLHTMTFYFILKWIPKIVVDLGFSPSASAGVLVWANVGGLLGSVVFGLSGLRFALRPLIITAMLASTAMVTFFGLASNDIFALSLAAGLGGLCTNAGMVGFYALMAASFPNALRAGGTGFVIGIGRGGAALSPIIGGILLQAGFSTPIVAATMACGSLLAALTLAFMPKTRLADA
jgi:benzoate transport